MRCLFPLDCPWSRLEQSLGQQQVLSRPRRIVDAGARRRTHAADAEELVLATDRLEPLRADARDAHALHAALALVEDTRARLPFNVSYDLALQALAYRLERTLTGASVAA